MNKVKYIDINAVCHVIGNIYKNPDLLDQTDKYNFIEEDFKNSFHKIIFSTLNNLYQLGTNKFSLDIIQDYLEQRPKAKAEYNLNKGDEYILKCVELVTPDTFPYYYQRVKKMSLLQCFQDNGMDCSWLYNPDILDVKKAQEQEDKLDTLSIEEIYDLVNTRIDLIREKYVDQSEDNSCHFGDGVDEYLESLKGAPALGYPLFGKYMNNVTRGARLSKFFLRSAPTGVGKTRSMIADACYIGCSQMYDLKEEKWITIGAPQPTLYIPTEQDLNECQTMALAFIAGVDEEHILTHTYLVGEWERVEKAKTILKNSKIYFEEIPDFTLKDIENAIKRQVRMHDVMYVFFDYIHSSPSLLMAIGGKSGVKNLREDNVLFLLASGLKDLAIKNDIFIMSGTQLNGKWEETETPDQNCLRGSKAIADRIDWGAIMLDVTPEDIEKLKSTLTKFGYEPPNVKLSIYKYRQGRWKSIYLWMKADKATCRYEPVFATDWRYAWVDLGDPLKIKVDEGSAFEL